jgi:hypothetical protein
MKKIILLCICGLMSTSLFAQDKLDDFGRIVLCSYYPENGSLPDEARQFLTNRLNQVTTNFGIGGTDQNARFVITAKINILSKDIIAGPPQKIAQQLEINIIIADIYKQFIFANTTFQAKGIGNNENLAMIDAIKRIDLSNPKVKALLDEGKNKIISFYATNCNFIIKDAITDAKQGKYNKAIYDLSLVPEVCQECYFKCLDTLTNIYQNKINVEGNNLMIKAKSVWASKLNPIGAEEVGDILVEIDPNSSAQRDAKLLINKIDAKLRADQRARWEFKLKQYNDKILMKKEAMRIADEKSKRDAIATENSASRNYELDKMRVNSYREVAITYAKNQPKQITNNRFIFLR